MTIQNKTVTKTVTRSQKNSLLFTAYCVLEPLVNERRLIMNNVNEERSSSLPLSEKQGVGSLILLLKMKKKS